MRNDLRSKFLWKVSIVCFFWKEESCGHLLQRRTSCICLNEKTHQGHLVKYKFPGPIPDRLHCIPQNGPYHEVILGNVPTFHLLRAPYLTNPNLSDTWKWSCFGSDTTLNLGLKHLSGSLFIQGHFKGSQIRSSYLFIFPVQNSESRTAFPTCRFWKDGF